MVNTMVEDNVRATVTAWWKPWLIPWWKPMWKPRRKPLWEPCLAIKHSALPICTSHWKCLVRCFAISTLFYIVCFLPWEGHLFLVATFERNGYFYLSVTFCWSFNSYPVKMSNSSRHIAYIHSICVPSSSAGIVKSFTFNVIWTIIIWLF